MPDITQPTQATYDPRWFIWTIVFLVSTGVMLVSYIVISSNNEVNDVASIDVKPGIHSRTQK